MLDLNLRVKHKTKGWFGKTVEYVTAKPGLIRVAIEDTPRVDTIREADLEPASDDDNQACLYREMVKVYLKAAERALVRDWKNGRVPKFGDGNPYELTYTGSFAPDVLAQIAEKMGFKLPKVLIITTTGL